MTWQPYFAMAVVLAVLVLLCFTSIAADVLLIGAVMLYMVAGILSPADALAGLSNEGMVTVGILFVVGAGVRDTGAIDFLAQRILGRPKTTVGAITRLVLPTATMSAFVNNTPLVAMLIPAVNDWSKQLRVAPSKLMIPLSYAAILGGTCTLVGTSTNLVVNGLYQKATHHGLGMFDISWVGIPAALIGSAYIILLSRWLLPDRRPTMSNLDDPREYTVEMLVEPDSPLVGKTIEKAGLRHLQGVYLAEVDRDGVVLPAVAPETELRDNDRLVFVGVVDSMIDLQKIRGLVPATNQVFKLDAPRSTRCLVEAVVSNTCPMVGKTIRDGRFRSTYNAVVVAVARNGQRVQKKIGDIALRAGDTLLVEAHPSFVDQNRNSRDFYLVSRVENSAPPRHDRALISMAILVGMVAAVGLNLVSMLVASLVAAALMLTLNCCTVSSARQSIDWSVLLAIAAALSLAKGLENSGAAKLLADNMIQLAGGHAWASLAVVYLVTLTARELITNNAAAALMFPLAFSTAQRLHVQPMAFVIVVMMAASAGFATPIGYQTNLMVYGPGGYKFSDYLKIGIPLDILIGVVTVVLAPLVWPL